FLDVSELEDVRRAVRVLCDRLHSDAPSDRIATVALDILLDLDWETTPTVLAYMDSMIGMLRAGGFSMGLTHHAMHAMGSRLMGFTQELFNDTTPSTRRWRRRCGGRWRTPTPLSTSLPDGHPRRRVGRRPGSRRSVRI